MAILIFLLSLKRESQIPYIGKEAQETNKHLLTTALCLN